MIISYRRFGTTHRSHLQVSNIPRLRLHGPESWHRPKHNYIFITKCEAYWMNRHKWHRCLWCQEIERGCGWFPGWCQPVAWFESGTSFLRLSGTPTVCNVNRAVRNPVDNGVDSAVTICFQIIFFLPDSEATKVQIRGSKLHLIFKSVTCFGLHGHIQKYPINSTNCLTFVSLNKVGCNSSVGMATFYWLDAPGIESWRGQYFTNPSIPTKGPTQPPT